ncbi:MAG: histidine phosphatase family protein [Verrucomicrobia bacterium]|nr:histidine phosphatase family protein [Verrucomicrobiota bacterium]
MFKTFFVFVVSILFSVQSTLHAEQRLLLMRHGEGEQNKAGVWDKNAPLTEEGKLEVRKLARKLIESGYSTENIGPVFISPLPRVRETAEILADAGLIDLENVVVEPRLTKRDMGKYEGQPVIHWGDGKKDDLPLIEEYGVEHIVQIRQRIGGFYQDMMRSGFEGHYMIITHGSITREIMEMHMHDRTRLKLSEVKVMPLFPFAPSELHP